MMAMTSEAFNMATGVNITYYMKNGSTIKDQLSLETPISIKDADFQKLLIYVKDALKLAVQSNDDSGSIILGFCYVAVSEVVGASFEIVFKND